MQNARDITAKYEREQENRLLMRELDHRVKNSLATVQAITRMSLVEGKSIPEAKDELLGRLCAMSDVQSLLVERNWRGSNVEAVLANALLPFGYEPGNARIVLTGPKVRVTAKQVQARRWQCTSWQPTPPSTERSPTIMEPFRSAGRWIRQIAFISGSHGRKPEGLR